jgi:hypothetical protein
MSMKLTHLLSLAALLAASPAVAQDAPGGLSLSAPPNFSSSQAPLPPSSSQNATPPFFSNSSGPPNFGSSEAPPVTPSSEPLSHMSEPPNFSSSTDQDVTPPDEDTSGEPSEPAGPPLSSTDAVRLFVDTCTTIAGGAANARDKAQKAGWQADEPEDNGPYVTIYSAYQELAGYGSVDLWSSLETFPTSRLGYCRLDFGDVDALLNFNDFTKAGLNGTITDNGNGNVYGSWESADHKTMLAANRTDGQVQMEFNILLPPASK